MTIEEAAKNLKSRLIFYPDIRKIEVVEGKIHLTCDTERVFELFKSVYKGSNPSLEENMWEGYELTYTVIPVEEEVTFGTEFEFPEQPFEKTLRVEAALREQEEAQAADKVTSQMITDTLDNPSPANIKKLSKHLGEKVIHDDGKLIVSGKGGARVIMKNPLAKEMAEAMKRMTGGSEETETDKN